jgi:hypothetical protein
MFIAAAAAAAVSTTGKTSQVDNIYMQVKWQQRQMVYIRKIDMQGIYIHV